MSEIDEWRTSGEQNQAGILIYTAAADSDGTLGGLVDLGKPENLGRLLEQALNCSKVCCLRYRVPNMTQRKIAHSMAQHAMPAASSPDTSVSGATAIWTESSRYRLSNRSMQLSSKDISKWRAVGMPSQPWFSLVSPAKVEAIASRIRRTDMAKSASALSGVVGTPVAAGIIDQLVHAWQSHPVSPDELASMLLAASRAFIKASAEQSTELVWTGPTTPFVSARRTEQALLQVINAAKSTLFITSFVAYDVSGIVKALNEACDRGVHVSMLLESSQDHGGSITIDVIGKMKALVPLPGSTLGGTRSSRFPMAGFMPRSPSRMPECVSLRART